jgi:hypothetical protein
MPRLFAVDVPTDAVPESAVLADVGAGDVGDAALAAALVASMAARTTPV